MARKPSKPETADPPSFEEALEQLEATVHQLEEGEIGLNESLKQYEKGVNLLRRCYDLLRAAERRIEFLSGVDAQGNPISEPIGASSPPEGEDTPGRIHSPEGYHTSSSGGDTGPEETDMDASGGVT
ncbi:MAG: exodeoxyribonuclease VII small subunit [Planctomycetes bacterium RBG_16_64_12]|nr:MAG: exodeoxyribonuclease VII small subunit [Planctomycetes bacterium RBG_16_64_12]